MMWSSDKGDPPFFTLVANGVIEQLLECHYFLSAYVSDHSADGPQIVIDISARHRLFPEFPGPSLGRVVVGPGDTEIHAIGRHQNEGIYLDAANPKSLQKLTRFFRASDRHDLSGSAATQTA